MRIVSIVLLAGIIGCAFVQMSSGANAATYREKVLYSFCGQPNCADGAAPDANLIQVNGMLYGTTNGGGRKGCTTGCGTVFSLDPSTGTEKVLYSFCGQSNCADGANPAAGLISLNGILYGTTYEGGGAGCGNPGCGTVFSINPNTGTETVIHSFIGETDGANPQASLTLVKSKLYGTTYEGGGTGCGGQGCGTVFSVNPDTGTEKVLYSFCSQTNCGDGQWPTASLTNVNGILYGTTEYGGVTVCGTYGCGTAFAFDLMTGHETVPYTFCSQQYCADGWFPQGNLIDMNGSLFGTTLLGGANCQNNSPPGCGTVFTINPNTGSETVLYSFSSQQNGADGEYPSAALINVKGTFYSTTTSGGAHHSGTAFSLDPNTGAETVIYSFCSQQNCTDGWFPTAKLIEFNGKLYGTTLEGGAYGYGTVFVLKKRR